MMIRKTLLSALMVCGLSGGAMAAGEGGHIEDISFSFEGPFGSFDPQQLQRGLQVFQEVCSACHGIRQVYFRNLGDPGGPEMDLEQVRAFTALYEIEDPETGEYRPAALSDNFPANTAAGAPDLSLMAKARAGFHGPLGTGLSQFFNGIGGPEYIHALLTGYTGETREEAGTTYYENTAFSTGWIAMPPPLMEDMVEYRDGSPTDVEQMSTDVSAFLMWTAEPKMMARKEAGLTGVIFLGLLAVLLYLTNKKLWAKPKRKG